MMRRNRQFINQSGLRWKVRLFVLLLLATALAGWWWVLQRTLANERDAMLGRLQEEREERFRQALVGVTQQLEQERDVIANHLAQNETAPPLADILTETQVDAILCPEPEYRDHPGHLARDRIIWASNRGGRDSVLRKALRKLADEQIRQAVRARLLGQEGPPMKPSFRSWAIDEYLTHTGNTDELLYRLKRSEALRAHGELPDGQLTTTFEEAEESFAIWSQGTIERLFAKAGSEVILGPQGQEIVPWSQELRVQARPISWSETGFQRSAAWIRRIGWGSALLFVVSVIASLWFGWRDTQLARMRMNLAASVAHELRTPLAGQQVVLESLAGGLNQTDEQRADYLQMALTANQRLGHLADQFLTFSRLERRALVLEPELLKLSEVIEEVMMEWHEKFDQVTITVEPHLQKQLDRQAVLTIVRNLVENAWKYSPERKVVSITVMDDSEQVILIVEDEGQGLTAAQRRQVFHRFWRAEKTLSRKSEGMGLGLSIVRQLARAHGGDVRVEKGQKGGTKFTVTIQER